MRSKRIAYNPKRMQRQALCRAAQPKIPIGDHGLMINKPPSLNRDYNRDPNIKALKKERFINPKP